MVPFAFAWSFLEKRKSFKTNILGGRPALYRIINLLDGGVRDRWGTSFVLGTMTTLIYSLTYRTLVSTDFPLWATVILIYAQALEATFLTLPFFVGLSTRFRLLGGVIGLLYALGWSVLSLYDFMVPVMCLAEEKNNNTSAIQDDQTDKSIDNKDKNELSAENSEIYVKHLMDPVGTKATQSIRKKYLQRITHSIPGFTYSNPMFSTAFMMAIVLYQKLLRKFNQQYSLMRFLETDRIADILQGCGISSGIATGIYGCSVIYSLLMTYKRHMMKLCKGERDFLPKRTEHLKPETHLIRSTQYMGNQIIGMIYGTIICFFCLFVPLTLLCLVFRRVEVLDKVPQLLLQFQIVVKAHDLFKFFMLFVNLSIGVLVFLRRLVSSIILGIFLIPRMDRSMFPKGFESDDKCYMNYVGMLMVDFSHNNPIMRVFCSILLKTIAEKHDRTIRNFNYDSFGVQSSEGQFQGHSRSRSKWLVAYTLMKNPSIIGMRKNALPGIFLMEAANARADVIDRVQRSIASTLFIYIGMIVVLMILAFLYFGIKAIVH